MTSRASKKSLSDHHDYPKRDVITEPSWEHFTLRGHSVQNLKGMVLETVKSKDTFVLRARESLLIKKTKLIISVQLDQHYVQILIIYLCYAMSIV